MKRIALAAVLLLAARRGRRRRPARGRPRRRRAAASSDSITVSGNGSVAGVPTSAVFSFGVDTRAATAKAALAANAREMRQVIAAVKASGGRQVGTQSVSVSQSLDQNGEPNGLRRLERRRRRRSTRPGRGADRRRRRRRREPGERPSTVRRRPGRALPQGARGRVADARLSAETLAAAAGRSARQGDVGRRGRRATPRADVREGRRLGRRHADRGGRAGDDGERDRHVRARVGAGRGGHGRVPATDRGRSPERPRPCRTGRRSCCRRLPRPRRSDRLLGDDSSRGRAPCRSRPAPGCRTRGIPTCRARTRRGPCSRPRARSGSRT